jgi:endonuclease YncB( thermonuclease family)
VAPLKLQPAPDPKRAMPLALLLAAWTLSFLAAAAILTAAYYFALKSRVVEPEITNLAAYSQQTPAEFLRAVDGDTIAVLIGGREERLQLMGVDAPEIWAKVSSIKGGGVQSDWSETGDAQAQQAAQRLEEMLKDKPLTLELEVPQRDRYGRLLGWAWAGKPGVGVLANEWMLQQKLAVLHSLPRDAKYAERMMAAGGKVQ